MFVNSLSLYYQLMPTYQWRYIQMAVTFILGLMKRDTPISPDVVKFLMEQTTSVQPTIRLNAQQ